MPLLAAQPSAGTVGAETAALAAVTITGAAVLVSAATGRLPLEHTHRRTGRSRTDCERSSDSAHARMAPEATSFWEGF
jgi:hypothetical protein